MALFSEYVERTQQGANITDIIHMRPIAVRESGVLVAMQQDFADGDASFPNIVNRAPLRIRTANDGMRKFFPIPGNDAVYFEMGAPFVKVGGTWTQVGLGTPSRSGNVLTWTRPQSITRFVHGGHFGDLTIELLGGFVPEDSQIAFPVNVQGLTRSGVNLLHNGVTVARMRPFAMVDLANPFDRRAITHTFPLLGGQRYVLLTLPSLAGMSRPTIDPTLELQPDASAGKDTIIRGGDDDKNQGANEDLNIGELAGFTLTDRALVQYDLSSIPATATVDSATWSWYVKGDFSGNARTCRLYRLKRAWVEGTQVYGTGTGATWQKYDTTNDWQTSGGFGANDCEQTDIGSRAFTATETINQFKDFSLTASAVQEWISGAFANNGFLSKMDTESDDGYQGVSSDSATAAQRPKLTVTYTAAAAARMFMFYQRLRQ